MDVVFLVEHARGDGSRRHARCHTAREAREQQRHGKDGRARRAQDGGERGRCDGEVVYDYAARKEGRCGQDDHGRVDCPAHAHRKERVKELVAQTLLDNLLALAFEVHGLDDLGVQKEIVRHDDRPQDTHDNRGRASGHTRRDPACGGLRPVDLD